MRCLQCGKRVSLLRKLTDGEFCSDEHRQAFQQQQNDLALARLIEAQRGMTRPAPKPAAAAPAKPAKAAAKQAEQESLPPFGPFLPLALKGLRQRRIHESALVALHDGHGPCVPAVEFRTLISGVPGADRLDWSGARSQAPAAAGRTGLESDPVSLVRDSALPRYSGSVEELAAVATPAPEKAAAGKAVSVKAVAGKAAKAAAAKAASAKAAAVEAIAVEAAAIEAAVADPPLAGMLQVAASGPATGLTQAKAAAPAPAAFGKQALRWVPVRSDRNAAPAPEAGLVDVPTVACALAQVARASAAAAVGSMANGAVVLPAAAGRALAATVPHLSEEVLQLGQGAPVSSKLSLALAEGPASAWSVPAASMPVDATGIAWNQNPRGAGLSSIEAPRAAFGRGVLYPGAEPATATAAAVALPAAGLATDQFDFWTWLEILTAPPAAQQIETAPEAPVLGLELPQVAAGRRSSTIISRALQTAGMPAFASLASTADASAFWAMLDRLTARESAEPVVSQPAAADPEPDEEAPPLFQKLAPILAWQLCEPGPVEIRFLRSCHKLSLESVLQSVPALPKPGLRPDNAESAAGEYAPPKQASKLSGFSLKGRFAMPQSWKVWQHAPADLKWVAVGLPLILALVLYSFRGSLPKEQAGVKLASSQSQSILGTQFASMQKVIMQRAAIHLLDDFRSGLSAWEGKPGWAKSWKYGQATFLEPGQLAVYKPTVAMSDYTLEFLGQIERQGMSWVVRADGELRNYHVLRLVVTRPGPLPEAAIVRYSVKDGKEGPVTSLPLPFPIKLSTMYRVRVEVRGKEITTYLQGQVVDSFTDTHLRAGGVGFFAPKGEKALLRWVEVTHQYDYLGRFCALLAPYDVQAGAERAD